MFSIFTGNHAADSAMGGGEFYPNPDNRTARAECGIAWIRLPDDGDTVGDKDFSILVIRNMLAAPDFAGAVQNPLDDKDLPKMGEYLPKGQYMFPNSAESLFPCPLGV